MAAAWRGQRQCLRSFSRTVVFGLARERVLVYSGRYERVVCLCE